MNIRSFCFSPLVDQDRDVRCPLKGAVFYSYDRFMFQPHKVDAHKIPSNKRIKPKYLSQIDYFIAIWRLCSNIFIYWN